MPAPKETIRLGQIEIRFLLDGDDTDNRCVMFEFLVPPHARVPAPHSHLHVDEALYGLDGHLTFTVGGTPHDIGPGDHCFVPRGIVHGFVNTHADTARVLAILTPASIGPAYFREIGALLAAPGPPDPAQVAAIMERHGLHPAPA